MRQKKNLFLASTVVIGSLTIGASAMADSRANDLKHNHCFIGFCSDFDNSTPLYKTIQYYPYSMGASVGIYKDATSGHAHSYVNCPCQN